LKVFDQRNELVGDLVKSYMLGRVLEVQEIPEPPIFDHGDAISAWQEVLRKCVGGERTGSQISP
jgi:hypothetical protein